MPPSKKDRLASLLSWSRSLRAARALRRPRKKRFLVLAYHRILPVQDESTFPFDVELISATPEDFDWQVGYLTRHFTLMPLSRLLHGLATPESLPDDAVAITFDDGFSDNYEYAYPILKAHGASATMFLATDFVTHGGPIWFEILSFVMLRAPVGTVPNPLSGGPLPSADSLTVRRRETMLLLDALKQVTDGERVAYVERVAKLATGFDLQVASALASHACTWDQVREMARNGIEFGSHTVSHPILTRVTDEQLATEMLSSRFKLEAELGTPVDTISYPVGGVASIRDRVSDAARAAGYRFGVSYQSDENLVASLDPFAIKRLHVERYTTRERFDAMMTLPRMFGYEERDTVMPLIEGVVQTGCYVATMLTTS